MGFGKILDSIEQTVEKGLALAKPVLPHIGEQLNFINLINFIK